MIDAFAPILADSGLNGNVWVVGLAGAISFGMPLTLAALGEILAERAGVLNLGIEGMMLLGAVCAFLAGDAWHNPWLALAAGVLAGGALSLVHAFLCVSLRANQIVSGLALVIFGSGLALFIGQSVEGKPRGTQVRPIEIPLLHDIPIIGRVLFDQDVLVYATFASDRPRGVLPVPDAPRARAAFGRGVAGDRGRGRHLREPHPLLARVDRRPLRRRGWRLPDAGAGAVVEPGPHDERHRLDRARARRVLRVASGSRLARRDHFRLRAALRTSRCKPRRSPRYPPRSCRCCRTS